MLNSLELLCAGVGGRSVRVHEHIPGIRKRARGETLSQNWTVCLHASQATCQRGTFHVSVGSRFNSNCVHLKACMVCYPLYMYIGYIKFMLSTIFRPYIQNVQAFNKTSL